MKHRVESSAPCSGPDDAREFGLPLRGTSPICGHKVRWCDEGRAQISRASWVTRTYECCLTCMVYRTIATAEGMYAEEYLDLCHRLQLPSRWLVDVPEHQDDFTEFDFWLAWASGSGGRKAALEAAAEHGYRLDPPH